MDSGKDKSDLNADQKPREGSPMNGLHSLTTVLALGLWLTATAAQAATAVATVNAVDENGIGAPLGTLHLKDTKRGLWIHPHLRHLPPGDHGMHVHANPSCAPGVQDGKPVAGLGAGGHLDPMKTGMHKGPMADGGHLGDLPFLTVGANGKAHKPVVAPHLKVADVIGHAIIIHAGGDNYADDPKPLGGGGPRIACAVVTGK
jgi:Cu-Zn family superoxide dismutase